ncbi:hypothetical protein J2P12_00495 [Candidatus Bathyarchaeota archaeon]|nr:hypothetical protein [Candidatus Bathyarchaeota archaeon]
MEPALIQFLIGLVGGSALGFAIMRRDTRRPIVLPSLPTLQPSATSGPSQPVQEQVKTTKPEPVLAASILAIAQSPAQPLPVPITLASKPLPTQEPSTFHVCPACGLQAPEKLMTEHFQGSPLHRTSTLPAPAALPSAQPASIIKSQITDSVEEVGRSSLGDLLQTLNVMERLLKRDFYRHELRVRSGISGRMTNVGGWIPQPLPLA